MAPALLSNEASWFLTWVVITWLAPPINCSPMNTAGTLGLHPICTNAFSTSWPLDNWSSSYTVIFAPCPEISVWIEWLMQQLLLLNITTGFSATKLLMLSIWMKSVRGNSMVVFFIFCFDVLYNVSLFIVLDCVNQIYVTTLLYLLFLCPMMCPLAFTKNCINLRFFQFFKYDN